METVVETVETIETPCSPSSNDLTISVVSTSSSSQGSGEHKKKRRRSKKGKKPIAVDPAPVAPVAPLLPGPEAPVPVPNTDPPEGAGGRSVSVRDKLSQGLVVKFSGTEEERAKKFARFQKNYGQGVPLVVKSSAVHNAHEFSANYRMAAEAVAMGDAFAPGEPATLNDLWGCRRTAGLALKLGIEYTAWDFGVAYNNDDDKGPRVDLGSYDGVVGGKWLMVDVYHANPSIVCRVFERSTTPVLYVVTRRFVGEAGADEEPGNMCWHRDSEGLIQAVPDFVNPGYPPHPDVEWMFSPIQGVLAKIITTVGPYTVIKMTPTRVPQTFIPVRVPWCVSMPVQVRALSPWEQVLARWWKGYSPPAHVLVHPKTLEKLLFLASARPMHGSAQSEVHHLVVDVLSKDPVGAALHASPVYHSLFKQVVRGTSLAVLANSALVSRERYGVRVNQADHEEMLRASRRQFAPTHVFWYHKLASYLGSSRAVSLYALVASLGLARLSPRLVAWGFGFVRTKMFQFMKVFRKPGALVKEAPITSAVLESALVASLPQSALHIAVVEAVRDKNIVSLPLHSVCYLLSSYGGWKGKLLQAIIHISVNAWSQRKFIQAYTQACFIRGQQRGQAIWPDSTSDDAFELGDVVSRPAPPLDHRIMPVAVESAKWPEVPSTELVYKNMITGTTIRIKSQSTLEAALQDAPGVKAECSQFCLIRSTSRVHSYRKDYVTALNAIVHRVVTRPGMVMVDEKPHLLERLEAWESLVSYAIDSNLLPQPSESSYDATAAMRACSAKTRRRLEGGFLERQVEGTVPQGERLFIKSNECLPAKKQARTVINVDPINQTELVAAAKALSVLFTEHVRPHVWRCGIRTVFVYYCSSMTQSELNAAFDHVDEVRDAIMVAGDDSYVKIDDEVYCNDFSKFDGSRSEGSVRASARLCAHLLRHPSLEPLIVRRTSFPFLYRGSDVRIKGSVLYMFPTGIITTTVTNGIDNIMCNAYVFRKLASDPHVTVAEAYAEASEVLGFQMKLKHVHHMCNAEFLKMWRVPTLQGGLIVMNLPSMLLKAAKVMNDPVLVFRQPDITLALLNLAHAIGASWRVPNDYPIFGTFLERCRSLGVPTGKKIEREQVIEDASYKTFLEYGEGVVDREAIFLMIAVRYSVSVQEVEEFDALISKITSFPWRLEHPVFHALLQDY